MLPVTSLSKAVAVNGDIWAVERKVNAPKEQDKADLDEIGEVNTAGPAETSPEERAVALGEELRGYQEGGIQVEGWRWYLGVP